MRLMDLDPYWITPMCWEFIANGDFNTLTVTPSIDASASGNWYGFISEGWVK